MGAVDLVLLVESPGAVARGLQRIGRAGHQVGEVSQGPHLSQAPRRSARSDRRRARHASGRRRGDPGAAQSARRAGAADRRDVRRPRPGRWTRSSARVRRAANFRELSREALVAVLDMLAGRYPSTDFAELRPRLVWDREADVLSPTRGAGKLALLSGGTIPDRGLYPVHLGADGPRVGELDEEMVFESRPGQTITLGASTWRVDEITRDRVLVVPAPGEIGRLPFWRGEGPGRPIELGRALGAFVRELDAKPRDEAETLAARDAPPRRLRGARTCSTTSREQREATGALPTDRAITIERFRDELGDWRVCILSPFGARVHAPWALALEARLVGRRRLRRPGGVERRRHRAALRRRRRAARRADARARSRRGRGSDRRAARPLGALRGAASARTRRARCCCRAAAPARARRSGCSGCKAQNLLAVARGFPSFPIVLETYRSCLQDVFDVPGPRRSAAPRARARGARRRGRDAVGVAVRALARVRLHRRVSLPGRLARGRAARAGADARPRHAARPARRRSSSATCSTSRAIEAVEDELQGRAEGQRVAHPDALVDLLRRVGDLAYDEIAARCESEPGEWLAALADRRRDRVDAHRGRVALDRRRGRRALPRRARLRAARRARGGAARAGPRAAGAAAAALRAHARAVPGGALAARASGSLPAQVEAAARRLEARGRLLSGEFRPGGTRARVVRRRSAAPHPAPHARAAARRGRARRGARARALPAGLARRRRATPAARGASTRRSRSSKASPLPFSDLERAILPARVRDFDPRAARRARRARASSCGSAAARSASATAASRSTAASARGCWSRSPARRRRPRPDRTARCSITSNGAAPRSSPSCCDATAPAGEREALDALWDLVWAGLVTNDTFAPLRALAHARREAAARQGQRRRRPVAGRWSLVAQLAPLRASTRRGARTRARSCCSIAGASSRATRSRTSRSRAASRRCTRCCARWRRSGKIRRGHFVDGLGGAQFAFAGAVDQLRAARETARVARRGRAARGDRSRERVRRGAAVARAAQPGRRAAASQRRGARRARGRRARALSRSQRRASS